MKGPCVVCRKAERPSVLCEGRWLVEEAEAPRPAKPTVQHDHHGLVVCKQCCIGVLGGQRCVWWGLCWGV